MDTRTRPGPLVVIVGQTASGKSALAIELAERFNGEIICADSRTVYKGLDVGSAKPTVEEQARVPHHLLDLAYPDEPFTVADFKRFAKEAIKDIAARGKLPIMVGGSGLYVDSVLFNYSFSDEGSDRDSDNPRHANREAAGTRQPLRENTLIIGLSAPREKLRSRVEARVDEMIGAGLVDEVRQLVLHYPDSKALHATSYKAIRAYIEGSINLDEAKAEFVRNDMALAKRQLTWFKRNDNILWLDNREEIVDIVTTFLSKNG